MNRFSTFFHEELGFSEYEAELINYYIKAIGYELSKFILMGIIFYYIDFLSEYLVAVIVLMLLRTSVGGLHFKTYWGCLMFTCLFFYLSIICLPAIHITKLFALVLLLICIITTYYIGPITSCYRETPTGLQITKCKRKSSTFIFIYCLLIYIMPINQYILTGFWVIILQTIQLLVAFILKKRRFYSEQQNT